MNHFRSIRALVFDLDGTLLNSRKKLSERTQNALLRCGQLGIALFIATARPPRSVKALLPSVIMKQVSAVYYNGAYCRDLSGNTSSFTISPAIAAKIITQVCRNKEQDKLSIESEDVLYALSNAVYEQNRKHMFVPPTVVSEKRLASIPANKLLLFHCSTETKHYIMNFGAQLSVVETDAGELLQIMEKQISKASAVSAICQKHAISMRQVAAFGDDWNDLDLFKACGYSVAMGNATPGLEKDATMRTGTNDEDGVAQILEKWFLN
ncbi:HAD family hydrolase [Sporolactobacillus terrae]|uniref:HAD family hydrolase n=1 Tax=Sporolactobacillus terrae TaxID=269673 RepID=UPI00048D9CEE|nr:HAD family hydrolase [Sporolactobacillus terrae]